jgi:hypothetical protein
MACYGNTFTFFTLLYGSNSLNENKPSLQQFISEHLVKWADRHVAVRCVHSQANCQQCESLVVGRPCFDCHQGPEMFRRHEDQAGSAPTRPTLNCLPRTLSLEIKFVSLKVTSHLHRESRLKMCEAFSPHPPTLSAFVPYGLGTRTRLSVPSSGISSCLSENLNGVAPWSDGLRVCGSMAVESQRRHYFLSLEVNAQPQSHNDLIPSISTMCCPPRNSIGRESYPSTMFSGGLNLHACLAKDAMGGHVARMGRR